MIRWLSAAGLLSTATTYGENNRSTVPEEKADSTPTLQTTGRPDWNFLVPQAPLGISLSREILRFGLHEIAIFKRLLAEVVRRRKSK